MARDTVVARELKALQEELSVPQPVRPSGIAAPARPADVRDTATTASPPQETTEERELRGYLGELASEATKFFEEAEKNIAMHPTQSVVGALLMGILIGSLLGRR